MNLSAFTPASQGMQGVPGPSLFPVVMLTPGEVAVFRKRERLSISRWAEKHRVVTDGPWQGPWKNEHTPHLTEPMDTWGLVGVREVTLVAPPQGGKTQVLYNCWAFGQDQEQAAAMMVMADQTTAGTIAQDRLIPILRSSPRLRDNLTDSPLDLGKERLRLRGSITYLAWATSVARLATMPIQQVFLDEVDKYPPWTPGQREADPVSLAEARTTTYRYTGKILKASTPTVEQGYIWQALLNAQEVRCYEVVCPSCGQGQIMRLEQLRWDESITDPNRLAAEHLAWYECESCGQPWHEAERRRAVRAGGYTPQRWDRETRWWAPAEKQAAPASVAFWFSAFVSPFVPLGEIAAAALRAQADKALEHNLYNKYLALPWRNEAAARDEDAVLALCDERPPGLVPEGAAALTATTDVQRNGRYFTIRAWAPGPERESWLVRAGFVDSWAALERVMFRDQYKDIHGQAYPIMFGLVDAGDGEMTREVNDWCLAHPPFMPSKGSRRKSQPFTQGKVETHPGLRNFNLDTTYYKNDLLLGKLHIAPGDPGAWHLHGDHDPASPDAAHGLLFDYARQLCSEAQDEQGVWQQIGRRPNHYLDCEVLQLVCADYLGLRFWPKEPITETPKETPRPQKRRTPKW